MFWYPNDNAKVRFRFEYNLEWQSSDLFALYEENGVIMQPNIAWQAKEIGDRPKPLLRIRDMEVNPFQGLMDALWSAGFRPSGEVRPDALIQTKNEHLADLRKIVDKFLESI